MFKKVVSLTAFIFLLSLSSFRNVSSTTAYYNSYSELLKIFRVHQYDVVNWPIESHQIPFLFLTSFHEKWLVEVNQMSVLEKKKIFFASIEPLVLRVNNSIQEERADLIELYNKNKSGLWSDEESQLLKRFTAKYKVNTKDKEEVFNELMIKVNQLPTSLILAQAAIESAYGTSRFTIEGNALFGQWTWDKDAIKPLEQREELGNYGVKSFPNLESSIEAYYLNINSHKAYKVLRMIRNESDQLNGTKLAEGLINYSELGMDYVTLVQSVIRVNKLDQTDDDFLQSKQKEVVIYPKMKVE